MISVSGCSRLTMKASKTSVIISNQHNKTQLSTRYTIAHSTTYYVHCSKSNRVLKAIEPAPRSFLQLPPFAKFYASSRRKVTDWLLCSNYYVVRTNYTSRDIQPKMRLLRLLLCVRVSIYRRRRYRAAAAPPKYCAKAATASERCSTLWNVICIKIIQKLNRYLEICLGWVAMVAVFWGLWILRKALSTYNQLG